MIEEEDSGEDEDLLSDRLGLVSRGRRARRSAAEDCKDQDESASAASTAEPKLKAEAVVSADVAAMRDRFVKMRQLKRQERENLDLERTQREHDEEWGRKMSAKYLHPPGSSDSGIVKSSSSAIHDVVSGLTSLYQDYAAFPNKAGLKKRVRAMEDAGLVSYGGRPGLIRREVGAAFGFDSYEDAAQVLAEVFRAAGNSRLAQQAEKLLLARTNNSSAMTAAPLRALLQRQLEDFRAVTHPKEAGDDASFSTSALSQLLSWLYVAAATGTGLTKPGGCARLGCLSAVAMEVLVQGSDDFEALNAGPSWEQFHATLSQYRAVPAVVSGDAGSGPPPYVNETGLEHALTYWTHDRLLKALHRESCAGPSLARVGDLITRLSRVLLDENLERLHPRALDGIRVLVLYLGSRDEPVPIPSSEDAAADFIFHDLPTAVGPAPRTAKYPDDDDASLAHAYLLGALLTMRTTGDDNDEKGNDGATAAAPTKLRRFLLACAHRALSCLGVAVPDESSAGAAPKERPISSSPEPTAAAAADATVNTASTPTTPSRGSASPAEVEPIIRPTGVGLEAWQAVELSVHVLESFPRDKDKGARCLAALDCAFCVFRAGVSWLPTSVKPCTEAAPEAGSAPSISGPPLEAVREFGAREQAKALHRLLERYSSGLITVGAFLGSMTRNEYFRHADLHLQVMTLYLEQTALPRCSKQAGIAFKASALKQQAVTKYLVFKSP